MNYLLRHAQSSSQLDQQFQSDDVAILFLLSSESVGSKQKLATTNK